MYVKRLRVEGLRGFAGGRAVDLGFTRPDGSHAGWTVLAGRNGSGKTSLLQALAVGSGYVPQRDWIALPGARVELTALLDASDVDWLDEFDSEEARSAVADEGLEVVVTTRWLPPRERQAPRARPRRDVVVRTAGTGLALDLPSAVAEDVVEYGVRERLLGTGAHRRLGRFRPGRSAQLEGLFDEDETLAEGVGWLVDLDHRRRNGDEAAAAELAWAMELLADGLLPDGHVPVRVDADGLWVAGRGGQEQPLHRLSDGYRVAVALVLHIARCVSGPFWPSVVLVDEVDAHLHVSWQQRIGPWLTAHFPRTQFLVTTHSPYICQAADPGGLIRLAGPDEDAGPQVVPEELYRRVVFGSGDDAVLSELFGLESPYSAEAERLRRRVGDLEADVLSGEADAAELEEYRELSEKLTSSAAARVDEVAARLARPA